MNKIQELTNQINEIEEQAGQLDPTNYEELYKLLAVAYFTAKDVIALLQDNLPLVEDNASEESLIAAKGTIAVLEVSLEVSNTEVAKITAQHTILVNAVTNLNQLIET